MNLQFKRGLKSNLPSYAPSGTPLWCEDTNELYMGTEYGVTKVGNNIPLTELECSSRYIFPEIDSAYFLYLSNENCRIILPNPQTWGVFHQILILLTMPTAMSLDLGTSLFLNSEEPDLSEGGEYNLIYEYHPLYNDWFCGVIKKKGYE